MLKSILLSANNMEEAKIGALYELHGDLLEVIFGGVAPGIKCPTDAYEICYEYKSDGTVVAKVDCTNP